MPIKNPEKNTTEQWTTSKNEKCVLKTPRSETNPEESTTKTTVVIKELHNEKKMQ